MRASPAATPDAPQDWNVLRTLCLFRALLSLLLIYVQPKARFLYTTHAQAPDTFLFVSISYVAFGLVLIFLLWRRTFSFDTQVITHITGDLAFIGMLVMLVQGLSQTIAILLCIPLAAAVLLRRPWLLYALASVATALLIAVEFTGERVHQNYYATLALSLAFFAVAQLSVLHIRRLHHVDNALRAQHKELTLLNELAEEILDASTQGLIVLDKRKEVRFVNATALMLLGTHNTRLPMPLSQFHEAVNTAFESQVDCVKDEDQLPVLRIHTSELRGGNTLVALMDLREIEAMTEQVRLASLGRWSASVAHEIRNPLSAISQALQLLPDTEDQAQLIDIMARNTTRIDAVVTDVLSLSRSPQATQLLPLDLWAKEFHREFCVAHPHANVTLSDSSSGPLFIEADDKRLYHIVSNLCGNALAHGSDNGVHLDLSTQDQAGLPHSVLTVSNCGEPLAAAQRKRMFEPFFTTSIRGSGIGLFVVRELCEQLGFSLSYDFSDGHHKLSMSAPTVSAEKAAA